MYKKKMIEIVNMQANYIWTLIKLPHLIKSKWTQISFFFKSPQQSFLNINGQLLLLNNCSSLLLYKANWQLKTMWYDHIPCSILL